MDQRDLAKILHRLAQLVERSSKAELGALLSGSASLAISPGSGAVRDDDKRDPGKRRRPHSDKDLAGLAIRLRHVESREMAYQLLARAQLTKNELEQLARMLDLPVQREDDAEKLRQKIIEASIGSRLNSRAIIGE